jgi:hypothetical protein
MEKRVATNAVREDQNGGEGVPEGEEGRGIGGRTCRENQVSLR